MNNMDYSTNTTSTSKLKYNELNKLLEIKRTKCINSNNADNDDIITNSDFIFRKEINY